MLVLTFLSAFLLRLVALNQSLWLDEGTTARVLQRYGFSQIISVFSPHDFHPPLYYLFLKFWTNFFGYSEIALRMPSVLFSLGAGWFVYLIGKKIKNKTVGLWAAAFFLFNPLVVYYSQEARMYMMATFLLTGMLHFFIKLLDTQFFELTDPVASSTPPVLGKIAPARRRGPRTRATRQFILLNILIFLSFLTFYGSVFLIATIYLYLLVKKQFRLLFLLFPGFVLALIAVSPLLYHQYLNSREQLVLVANWSNILGTVNVKNLLLIPLKFSIGRISWEPKAVYYGIAGLWSVFVFYPVILNSIEDQQIPDQVGNDKKFRLLFLFVAPIIMGVVFSFFSPLLQYFRFLYLIPPMSLLIAMGTGRRWQRIILLAGFTVFSLVYLLNSNFHREDWKSLAESLPKKQKVYMIPSSADPLLYYNSKTKVQDLRNTAKIKERTIVIIPYTADIYGFNYEGELKKNHYTMTKTAVVRGLTYEEWKK